MQMKIHHKMIMIIAMAGSMLLGSCKKDKEQVAEKEPEPQPVAYNWVKAADSAQGALTKQYWSVDEKYYNQNNDGHTGFNYWWNAHALDVLVDGYIRTKDPAYTARMDELLTGMYKKNGNKWENNFYDDMEWLAIACIRAYEATQ